LVAIKEGKRGNVSILGQLKTSGVCRKKVEKRGIAAKLALVAGRQSAGIPGTGRCLLCPKQPQKIQLVLVRETKQKNK
jgi:hypothetical protein